MPMLKTVNGNLGDGHFLFGQYNPNKSGENITLAPTTVELPAGTVLGRITASGLYVPRNPAAADGSQNFAAFLFGRRPISTTNQRAAGVVRDLDGVVNSNLITYVVAHDATQRAAAEAQAAAAGIICRK